jgi:energy-coupling factor transporter transmembrane protein EcfT
MDFTTIFIIASVVLAAIFFLIAKLAVRWILRLIIVGVILIAILGAGIFWWWSSQLTSKPESNRQRPPTGRTPSR